MRDTETFSHLTNILPITNVSKKSHNHMLILEAWGVQLNDTSLKSSSSALHSLYTRGNREGVEWTQPGRFCAHRRIRMLTLISHENKSMKVFLRNARDNICDFVLLFSVLGSHNKVSHYLS